MSGEIEQKIQDTLKDTIIHRNFVVILFSVISIAIVAVGMVWPKIYSSSATIFVEEENILGPLMQGAAVQTEVIDRASIAREMIYGRKIMMQVLERQGLLEKYPDPAKQERIIDSIKSRTTISNVRNNLVKIEFSDTDPVVAYEITAALAELFIEESLNAKARESQSAFEFIEQQVREYRQKLLDSEEELKRFRAENADARPGMIAEIGRRESELQSQLQQSQQELREARIRQSSLRNQLTGQAEASTMFSRAEQYKTRLGELQAQLDALRLSYHETYPDIVQLKAQIEDLREAIAREEGGGGPAYPGGGRSSASVDEVAMANPIYQELQRQLYESTTLIKTLEARIEQSEQNIADLKERGQQVQEYEARLAELTRDKEVNQDIYSDLIRRREQARVSMNLDKEKKGLTLRIDEPAYLPHKPTGLRFVHFLMGGPLAGLLIPIGLLFSYRQLSPRIRSVSAIPEEGGPPVIGVIPHFPSNKERRLAVAGLFGTGVILFGGIAGVAILTMLRMGMDS